jgi:hypothetical protein
MSVHSQDDGLFLPGLDGTNPLGFLAALGVLQLLTTEHKLDEVKMSWSSREGLWHPVLYCVGRDRESVAAALAKHLKCPFTPSEKADCVRVKRQEAFDKKKSERKKAADELKRQGLLGNERKAAEKENLGPIDESLNKLRSKWLAALRRCVPSLELSLGKHLNATCSELREHMTLALDEASHQERNILDLYAAFGSDACSQDKSDQMLATNFCFITGSGHQNFLDTIRQLTESVTADRIMEAVFSQVEPQDEKCSMRWDPQEDRRYAVMWSDPTAAGNKAKTNWATNLLAYNGLQLLPSVPRSKGLFTTGWSEDEHLAWNWPIWTGRISSWVIRSLLSHPLVIEKSANRNAIMSLGVTAVYQSVRVQVGNPPLHKVNFTPAHRVA